MKFIGNIVLLTPKSRCLGMEHAPHMMMHDIDNDAMHDEIYRHKFRYEK